MSRRTLPLFAALALALPVLADEAPVPAAAPEAHRVVEAAGLALRVPRAWASAPTSSSMRAAQLLVPGPAAATPGELVLFYFGPGQGGDFEANAARWLGQLEPKPGTEPTRGELASVGAFTIRWVEAAGTIKPSTMGTGPKEPQPGSRLIGAMVEGAGGPWFLKLTGPEATVAAARDAFVMMLRSASPAGAEPATPEG